MQDLEKSTFKKLQDDHTFNAIFERLVINKELDFQEQCYILSIAILFMKEFSKDRRYTSYLDIAYFIILKYSIKYGDYQPLYDFSTEFGFYPISKNILDHDLIEKKINDVIIEQQLNFYRHKENLFIQTLEQFTVQRNLLEVGGVNRLAFIAPTSYGKSSTIIDMINKYNSTSIKIGIIVPSKSLLIQTFKLLKKSRINKKFLLHDDMFDNEKSFIAIFTQERALRFLNNNDISFDILFIDEAHNLFNRDHRSILLSRFINKNLNKNPNSRIIYLSPLISDANNLKVVSTDFIGVQRINFNIKMPELFEYLSDGTVYQYDRFLGKFYYYDESYCDYFQYIKNHLQKKNFLYLRSPKKIEYFANDLFNNLEETLLNNDSISELIQVLKNHVHEKFYMVELLKKGILYLHGKLPDSVKEYLEHKFKSIPDIKYLVANSVILEGVNLPIDSMFILNVHSLAEKELTNLIGRVNRLDTVFTDDTNNLAKLLPKIHFINSDEYNRKNGKMKNTITKLRSRLFDDKIQNPTLLSFDMAKLEQDIKKAKNKEDTEKAIKYLQQVTNTIEIEKFLNTESTDLSVVIRKQLIEHGINTFYNNLDQLLESIISKIDKINKLKLENINRWNDTRLIDKIFILFIYNVEYNIEDFEFRRLKEKTARNYYHTFIELSHSSELKKRINLTFSYFKKLISENSNKLLHYFGDSYGEVPKESSSYENSRFNVYIDLSSKTDDELINLAIVKIQMEDNFVSYKLNKFVEFMKANDLITEDEYNLHLYGTRNLRNVKFMKFGLNNYLVNRLEKDNQLQHLDINEFGNLEYNSEFAEYLCRIDDFYRYQIEKFVS